MIYQSPFQEPLKIDVEDRKALCMGITRVLAVLPSEKWAHSLTVLTNESVQCLENVTKLAEEAIVKEALASTAGQVIVTRMCEEIVVLGSILRSFRNATINVEKNIKQNLDGSPILSVLERIWPCLTHISQKHGENEEVAIAIGEFLLVAVMVENIDKSALLKEACNIATPMLARGHSVSFRPILEFIEGTITAYGKLADSTISTDGNLVNSENAKIREVIEQLLCSAFDTASSVITQKDDQNDNNVVRKTELNCSTSHLQTIKMNFMN